jgi:uncharacterized protein with GYD domain
MATYISLLNWTEQGIRNCRDTTSRAEAAAQQAEAMGGKMQHIYWTVGPYDLVTVTEFPDDQTATAYLMALGAQGNIRSTTLRAYGSEEMTQILGKIG